MRQYRCAKDGSVLRRFVRFGSCAGIFGAALLAGGGLHVAAQQSAGAAAPCTTSTSSCEEWVPLGGGGARSMIYRSYPLTVKNTAIKRALIMVHGTSRNPDHYFATASAAAFLAGAQSDTLVIAPSFKSSDARCADKLQIHEVSWSCGGDSWRSGGNSTSNPELTSFDFVDEILRKLADRKVFPGMKNIVVAGHSAGGQFVSRYEMANRVSDTLGVAVSFVVSNPSSYAWPDATRALAAGDATPEAAALGWRQDTPHTNFSYGPFEASRAPGYDSWPYGLEKRTTGYTAKMDDETLKKQLVSRTVTYLLSQVDVLPLGGFDASPNAMAQGATRRARGEAFVKYVNEKLGGKGKIMIIPECGHNDRCVYTTDAAFPFIFPASN